MYEREVNCSECGKSCFGFCYIGNAVVCQPCFSNRGKEIVRENDVTEKLKTVSKAVADLAEVVKELNDKMGEK